jgi:D-alanyl-D-alanine carboxypeptidase/D-alanyl-D-alanine-endopeptidase (penicillin-binding protein 4)
MRKGLASPPFVLIAVFALTLSACGRRHVNLPLPTPATPVAASPQAVLQKDLSAIFEAPEFQRSIWSVLVRPASSSVDLYSLNSAKLVMPGSNMKILTLAAAADRLGWGYRFITKIVASAPVDSGILRGDLFIVGSGDPSISERSDERGILQALARQVRDAGIHEIDGRIIGDDDALDEHELGDGWAWDNLPYGYAAPVTALEYNEGSVDLVIKAGAVAGDPVEMQVRPDGSALEIENRLVTVAETGTGALTMERLPGTPHLIVRGQIPAKAAPFARTASVDNPTQFFANAFRGALISAGVQVDKGALDIDYVLPKPDLASARTLALRRSPPLAQLAISMMKVSQNQYAELLLKAMGGRQVAKDRLKAMGIADGSYILADGSGLSRYNYVTDEILVTMLQNFLQKPADKAAFVATLPIAGRDGTLEGRMIGTPAEAKVRAKTGTADNIRAVSGYVEDADGELLVFSMIANNFAVPASQITAAADRAMVRLATFTRRR